MFAWQLVNVEVITKFKNDWDVAKVVKARGFDPRIRRFESCRPSHFFMTVFQVKNK